MLGLLAQSQLGLRYFTFDEVLSPYVYVFYASYLVAFLFTPIMRKIAIHHRIIDEPDGVRKMHSTPVAYLGGVAVFLGWLSGLAMSQFLVMHRVLDPQHKSPLINFGIVIAACAIVLLGLWDDILHMSPWKKIMGQIFAAACLIATGVGKYCSWIFLHPILLKTCQHFHWPIADPAHVEMLQDHWFVTITSILFVIAMVVICCNATNLMDGLDGLCGGVTAIIAAGLLFLAVNVACVSGALNIYNDALRVILGLALLGGVLGFIPFNFNPASIFMGDTGSMFLGFACATMMILFAAEGHFKWFLASMVIFSLPLLDTALAFTRRWVNGRPLFSPDKYHFHHQLVARGFTVKQTVLISYGLAITFALLGVAIVYIRTRYAIAVYLVIFGSIIVAAYKMGMVHERVKAVTRKPLSEAAAAASVTQTLEPSSILEVADSAPVASEPPPPSPWKNPAPAAKA
jgi:UDP-GlcNAc:undecaprenyl-phosphate GlcNAc-1-phosphate transferase